MMLGYCLLFFPLLVASEEIPYLDPVCVSCLIANAPECIPACSPFKYGPCLACIAANAQQCLIPCGMYLKPTQLNVTGYFQALMT